MSNVPSTALAPSRIFNNAFGGGFTNTSTSASGMYINSSSNLDIYFNSINIDATSGRGLNATTSATGLKLLNNSFVYSGSNTGYAAYIPSTANVLEMDFNNYFSNGSNFVYYGTNRINLAALQSVNIPAANDQNSVSGNPEYPTPQFLHPLSGVLNNSATPISGIDYDIIGNLRDPITPDMGAYEYTPSPVNLGVVIIQEPLSMSCYPGIADVTIDINNIGTDTVFGGFQASYTLNHGTPVTETVSMTVAPSQQITYTFTTPISISFPQPDTSFYLNTYVNVSGDTYNLNDTLGKNITLVNMPAQPIAQHDTIAFGTSAVLGAVSTGTISWYDSPLSSNVLDTGATYTTPILYGNTPYYATARQGTGGAFIMTEICHFKTTSGSPVGGWPAYIVADDYIEITGAPNSDLGGFTIEQWNTSSMLSTHTFPTGTVLSPQGTVIIAVGQMGSSTPSPANFYYHGNGSYTGSFGSTGAAGRIIKDPNGNIIDAVAYGTFSFPAAAGVTPEDWTGNTVASGSGIRLEGPYTKDATNWINSSVSPQDPNTLNNNVDIPVSGCESMHTEVWAIIDQTTIPAIDVSPIELVSPVSGFNLTSQPVSVIVRNYGTTAVTNIPVAYSVNGGAVVSNVISSTLQPGDTLTFTFPTNYTFGVYGAYNFTVYTSLSNDLVLTNDTLSRVINNNALIYCVSSATSVAYGSIGNVTISNINNGNPNPVMSNPNANSMYNDYTTTVPAINLSLGQSYPISISGIWASASVYNSYVKVFIDYNIDGTFDAINELVFEGQMTSALTTLTGNVSIPTNASVGFSTMRVVMVETTSSTAVQPCGTYTWGETQDYAVILAPQLPKDAGVTQILSPTGIYSEGDTLTVSVEVYNYGTDTLSVIPLELQHNTNPTIQHTWTGTLAPTQTTQISLPSILAESGQNTICVKTQVIDDTNVFNDEKCSGFWGMPGLLYSHWDFEGNSVLTTTGNIWQHGKPTGATINHAFEGDSCWVTVLNGAYPANAEEFLTSPTLNFTGIQGAYLSLAYWMDGELNHDGGNIQYSTNNGSTWSALGFINDPNGYNWYDTYIASQPAWSEPTGGWKPAFIDLSPLDNAGNAVKLRFRFNSNNSVQNEGFAIDDVKIHVPAAAVDAGVNAIINPQNQSLTGLPNQVTVRLKNYGTTPITSIPVTYALSQGPPPVNETWTGNLAPGEETLFTFNVPYTGPFLPHNLCVYTSLTGDFYKFNDTSCVSLNFSQAQVDGGVVEIVAPLTIGNAGDIQQVSVVITNHGIQPLTNFPVQYSVNGVNQATEIIPITLQPAQTLNYTFITTHTSPGVDYQLCAKTAIPGDGIPTNDHACRDLSTFMEETEDNKFSIYPNTPNPATDFTQFNFSIPTNGYVTLSIYSVLGQTIESIHQAFDSGKQTIVLDIQNYPSGVYFFSVQFEDSIQSGKLIISK
jgi:hypothetical protein